MSRTTDGPGKAHKKINLDFRPETYFDEDKKFPYTCSSLSGWLYNASDLLHLGVGLCCTGGVGPSAGCSQKRDWTPEGDWASDGGEVFMPTA